MGEEEEDGATRLLPLFADAAAAPSAAEAPVGLADRLEPPSSLGDGAADDFGDLFIL